jgi:hypothetical protein
MTSPIVFLVFLGDFIHLKAADVYDDDHMTAALFQAHGGMVEPPGCAQKMCQKLTLGQFWD